MFYNGFTLLMQILAGMSMYYVGRHFGYHQGEQEMYQRCRSADAARREFFSDITRQ